MRRPKKTRANTPRKLVIPIGSAFTENGGVPYRNWGSLEGLPLNTINYTFLIEIKYYINKPKKILNIVELIT